jgi:hypothetical protein
VHAAWLPHAGAAAASLHELLLLGLSSKDSQARARALHLLQASTQQGWGPQVRSSSSSSSSSDTSKFSCCCVVQQQISTQTVVFTLLQVVLAVQSAIVSKAYPLCSLAVIADVCMQAASPCSTPSSPTGSLFVQ